MRAALFSVSATCAGILAGALVGLVGATLTLPTRAGLATLVSSVGVLVSLAAIGGTRFEPLQCDRLTPKRWARQSALGWAARNGTSLGVGAFTTLGFWLWYAVPLAALLSGDLKRGALIYGTYGLVRGLGVWAMIGVARLGYVTVSDWLISQASLSRRLGALALGAVAAFVVVAVGV